MNISDFFNEDLIFVNLKVKNKEELFEKIYEKLYNGGYVKKNFIHAINKREMDYPTGLLLNKYNVAIPHANSENVIRTVISVATLSEPIIFKNMADPTMNLKVNIVFMIALSEAHSQVELLKQLTKFMQKELLLQKLMDAKGGDEILNLICNFFEGKIF